jgi:hypothetical protein
MGRGTRSRQPLTHGGRAVIFAIEDAIFDELRPQVIEAAGAGFPGRAIEVRRASELKDPSTEADLWFGSPPPRRPGFALLCETLAGQIFEQQVGSGAIYRDGNEVWPEAPVAIDTPMLDVHGEFRLLHDGAMLFQAADGRLRITGISLITGLFSHPTLGPLHFPVDSKWFDVAAGALGPGMR